MGNEEFVLSVYPRKRGIGPKFELVEKVVTFVDSIPEKYLEIEIDDLKEALQSEARTSNVLQVWSSLLIDYQNDILKLDGEMRYYTGWARDSHRRKIYVMREIRRQIIVKERD